MKSREVLKKYLITCKTSAVEHGRKGYRKIAMSLMSRTVPRKATVGHTGRGFRPRSNYVSGSQETVGHAAVFLATSVHTDNSQLY